MNTFTDKASFIQVTDNADFAKVFLDWLFARYLRSLVPAKRDEEGI